MSATTTAALEVTEHAFFHAQAGEQELKRDLHFTIVVFSLVTKGTVSLLQGRDAACGTQECQAQMHLAEAGKRSLSPVLMK